jgi:hypothetical protein
MLSLRNKLTLEASRAGAKRGTTIAAAAIGRPPLEATLLTSGDATPERRGDIENGSRERPLPPPRRKHFSGGRGLG